MKYFNYLLECVEKINDLFPPEKIVDFLNGLERIENVANLPARDEIATEGYKHPLCEVEEISDYRAMLSRIIKTLDKKFKTEIKKGTEIIKKLKKRFMADKFPEVREPWIDLSSES